MEVFLDTTIYYKNAIVFNIHIIVCMAFFVRLC